MQASDFFYLSLRSLSLNGVGVGTVSQDTQLTILISAPSKTLSTEIVDNVEKRKRLVTLTKKTTKLGTEQIKKLFQTIITICT